MKLLQKIRHWWNKSFLPFLFPPDLTLQTSKYAGVVIEIVPCEVSDDIWEYAEHRGGIAPSVDNPSVFQADNYPVESVKILSVGLPVYIPLQDKLLIVGKLVKPLPAVLYNDSSLVPSADGRAAICENLCQKDAQREHEGDCDNLAVVAQPQPDENFVH